MDWNIIATRGHYEVYSATGRFLFTADSKAEAMKELEEWSEDATV